MTWRRAALAAASGLLLTLAFPPVHFPLFAAIALVPLLFALNAQTPKTGFLLGGIAGLTFFVGTVYWVTHSLTAYGNIGLIPAWLLTLLLCAYLAFYPALFGATAAWIGRNRPSLLFVAAPAVWTTLELARTCVFTGFPWALLGYSQYSTLPLIQIADITGVYGISFLIVLVNTAVAELVLRRKKMPVIVAVVLLAGCLGYGYLKLRVPENGAPVSVAVIQGNIEQDKKWDPAYQAETIGIYKKLTIEALQHHPDLVIWPETSTPFYFGSSDPGDRLLSADLMEFVKQHAAPLLFGSPTVEDETHGTLVLRNSAFLLTGDGAVAYRYDKIHLVPFGEYVPLKRILFFVQKMVQAVGEFMPGKDYTVMTVADRAAGHDMKFSTVICYEIIFPDLVRKFVDRGATVVTTITNDAWFGQTAAPYQHFSMAVFRAVENRVPVARAANTGVSGFIDQKGRILAESAIFREAYLTRTLAGRTQKTFYTRFGDVFSYLCVVFSFAVFLKVPQRKA